MNQKVTKREKLCYVLTNIGNVPVQALYLFKKSYIHSFFAISALLPVYPYDIRRFHLHREVYFPFPPYKNHI